MQSLTGKRRGITLVEVLIAFAIMALLIAAVYLVWTRSRVFEDTLTAHSEAQHEVRRAFLALLKEVQQAIDVVLPAEGYTQPYLVIRDQLNRLTTFYLVPDPVATAQEGKDMFHLVKVVPAYPETQQPAVKEIVMRQVSSFTFSCRGAGGVILNLTATVDRKDYSLVTMVRLRALSALDQL